MIQNKSIEREKMILDNNFNNNFNNTYKNNLNNSFNQNNNIPRILHSNEGLITKDNSLLTNNINSFQHTDPTNTSMMQDKAVAMLQDRYKKGLISSEDFNKKCQNIGQNRQ